MALYFIHSLKRDGFLWKAKIRSSVIWFTDCINVYITNHIAHELGMLTSWPSPRITTTTTTTHTPNKTPPPPPPPPPPHTHTHTYTHIENNDRQFAYDIFRRILVNEKLCILKTILIFQLTITQRWFREGPIRRRAIIWTNADPIHRRIYAALAVMSSLTSPLICRRIYIINASVWLA